MVLINGVKPIDPFHLILIKIELEQCLEISHLVWNLHWLLFGFSQIDTVLLDNILSEDELLEEGVKLLSGKLINASSDTPDSSINKSIDNFVINVIWDLDVFLISENLSIWLNIALDQSNDMVHNKSTISWTWESAVDSSELNTEVNDIVEVFLKFFTGLCFKNFLQVVAIRCDVDIMTKLA